MTELKKQHLWGQNNFRSLGPKKLLKIVNEAMIKEINETEWRSRWNRRVGTNIHMDHSNLIYTIYGKHNNHCCCIEKTIGVQNCISSRKSSCAKCHESIEKDMFLTPLEG